MVIDVFCKDKVAYEYGRNWLRRICKAKVISFQFHLPLYRFLGRLEVVNIDFFSVPHPLLYPFRLFKCNVYYKEKFRS